MSTTINEGGPAFPTEVGPGNDGGFQSGNERWHAPGMALRDYFAAHANEDDIAAQMPEVSDMAGGDLRAKARYLHADSMLKARSS